MKLILSASFLLASGMIAFIMYHLYRSENKKNAKLKQELREEIEKKAKRELVTVSLTMADKKRLMKIFREKIEWMVFMRDTKDYVFHYKKGEASLSGINKDFAIIEVKIRKQKLIKQEYMNVTIKAWKTEDSFKDKKEPDKDFIDLLCKKEVFNSQILATMNQFFHNPSNKNTITIETE